MSSIELPNTTKNIKSNKYLKTEYNNNINYNKSESNLEKKSNIDNSFSVEMNHFRIVKFIQDTKKYVELRFKSAQDSYADYGFDVSGDVLPFFD